MKAGGATARDLSYDLCRLERRLQRRGNIRIVDIGGDSSLPSAFRVSLFIGTIGIGGENEGLH